LLSIHGQGSCVSLAHILFLVFGRGNSPVNEISRLQVEVTETQPFRVQKNHLRLILLSRNIALAVKYEPFFFDLDRISCRKLLPPASSIKFDASTLSEPTFAGESSELGA